MLQVTFCDVSPDANIVAQLNAAHAALHEQGGVRGGSARLSVTLSHRAESGRAPYEAVVECADANGRVVVRAEGSAFDLGFALRSALSVLETGNTAQLVSREYERRRALGRPVPAEPEWVYARVGT